MGIPAHIARLRAVVGHDLLLLPSVSVLPVAGDGRLLLVRHAGAEAIGRWWSRGRFPAWLADA
jgi:hypothetical protein